MTKLDWRKAKKIKRNKKNGEPMVEPAPGGLPKSSKSITSKTKLNKNNKKGKGVEIKWYFCKKCKVKFTAPKASEHFGNDHRGSDVKEISRGQVPKAR